MILPLVRFTLATLILATFMVCVPQKAQATETVACDAECSVGQKIASYADGSSVTCTCVAESEMEPTVPDATVEEGPVNSDSE